MTILICRRSRARGYQVTTPGKMTGLVPETPTVHSDSSALDWYMSPIQRRYMWTTLLFLQGILRDCDKVKLLQVFILYKHYDTDHKLLYFRQNMTALLLD